MAIVRVVDPVVRATSTSDTASGNHTCANGQTDLLVWVVCRDASVAAPASVTFGGIGLGLVTNNTATARGCQLYWLPKANHPGDGVHSLVIGTWTSADRVAGAIAEYTTATELEYVDRYLVTGGATNIDLAVTALIDELTLSICYRGGSPSYTPDSGQTPFLGGATWAGAGGVIAVVGHFLGATSSSDWSVASGSGATSSFAAVFREADAGGDEIEGEASVTLGALAASGTSALDIAGSGAITLGSLSSSAAATLSIEGAASISLGALTASGAATFDIEGQASVTLGSLTCSATGDLEAEGLEGSASIVLGALTSTGSGALDIDGSAAITLGALQVSATGSLDVEVIEGQASITLGALTSSSSAVLDVAGSASISLEGLSASAQASLALAGLASISLGPLTSAAASTLAIEGQASVTLGDLVLSAVGTDGSIVVHPKVGSVSHTPGLRLSAQHSPGLSLGISHTPAPTLSTSHE